MNAQQLPSLKIARLDNLTINFFAPGPTEFIEGAEIRAFEPAGSIPPLGAYWPGEGGHNTGLVRGENGQPDYYLIVAGGPDAEFRAAYGGYEHTTEGADSASDGQANTRALLADSVEHPAAKLASGYTADGHSDFYLPARRELQVAESQCPRAVQQGLPLVEHAVLRRQRLPHGLRGWLAGHQRQVLRAPRAPRPQEIYLVLQSFIHGRASALAF